MKIGRLNISHGSVKENERILRKFKEAQQLRPHLNTGLMLDLRGREIRTSVVEDNLNGVQIRGGSEVVLRCNDSDSYSTSEVVQVDYPDFLSIVRPKETIYIDDGKVSL